MPKAKRNTLQSHVVILGCGRSGTSIFGELFESIPGYMYHSEPLFDDVVRMAFKSPVAIKVPKESRDLPPSPGLSFPLHMLLDSVPEPRRFFWQVRHPLDAIASLRIGIAQNWGHHPRPPDWKDWLHRPLVERCAHHWSYINSVGYQRIKSIARVCRFEDMIAHPLDFARDICADVGIDPDTCEQQLDEWSIRVQDTNNEHFVEARTSRPYSRADHMHRVGRWRENLCDADLRLVVPIVRHAADAFSYQLPDVYPT